MSKKWFIQLSGQQSGPHSADEIIKLFLSGKITKTTLARSEDSDMWSVLQSISELSTLISNTADGKNSEAGGGLAAMMADEKTVSLDLKNLNALKEEMQSESKKTLKTPPKMVNDNSELSYVLLKGTKVEGLLSMQQLEEMAISGELSRNIRLWKAGQTDFKSLDDFPVLLDLVRKSVAK
jgi:hypothetical protein